MIVFDVRCGKGHVFEGWFADSATYEEQAADGAIACPVCGDTGIAKALMAPNLATGRSGPKEAAPPREKPAADSVASARRDLVQHKERAGRMMAMMRAVKDHVEKNFEHVGPRFAEEARKIHYGECEKRGIFGQADRKEADALREEGIEFSALPEIPELNG